MKSIRLAIACALAACALSTVPQLSAAVFQYSVPVATKKQPSEAFLWIPPQAARVRGVVLGGMTLAERELVKDERIRRACAEEQLALVFLKCGLGACDLQTVLDDLAKKSGYAELAAAPLFFVGHSAGGPQAQVAAIAHAKRCFGLMQFRGGGPYDNEPVPPGVPTLMMVGQFDEFGKLMRDDAGRENWENNRDKLAAFRAADERNLASIVVEPGAGHFSWSERCANYLALFIRKAAQARIPPANEARSSGELLNIDHRTGWLTDLAIKAPAHKPAAHTDYTGDKNYASWHFDKELAQATLAYHAGGFDKKDQFLRWTDGHHVDAGARFFFNELKWIGDGQTFEVHPVYDDAYPSPQPNGQGPRWALSGKPVGKSAVPITVKQVSGPIRAIAANAFRIEYDALSPATEPAARVTFMAVSPGDAEYRYTERVGMTPRGFGALKEGKDQTIAFELPSVLQSGKPIDLAAKSDADLPVHYYVASGPASIVDGKLVVSELPQRAKFPIAVKVVAYQFGRALEPHVQSAAPVERTCVIEQP